MHYVARVSSSTCFGQFFAHPQERKIMIYIMWYNVPRLLSAAIQISKLLLLHLVGHLLCSFSLVPEILTTLSTPEGQWCNDSKSKETLQRNVDLQIKRNSNASDTTKNFLFNAANRNCRSEAWSAAARTISAAAPQASYWQQSVDIIPRGVNQNVALLRMGKELRETCWANLKISKLLWLHLVGHLLYLCQWCTVKNKSKTD